MYIRACGTQESLICSRPKCSYNLALHYYNVMLLDVLDFVACFSMKLGTIVHSRQLYLMYSTMKIEQAVSLYSSVYI